MRKPICGIDLGTTNSCISYLRDGKATAITVDRDLAIVPSVVSLDEKTGRIIVGSEALNRLAAFPEQTIRSIKRLMGMKEKVTLGARTYSPEELSSFILKFLVDNAARITGQEMSTAVITVPAYFNDAQRRATISAGELAGLEVLRIINEPTAAALAYDYVSFAGKVDSPFILVYDLGGGTFDVSVLEVKGEIKEVLSSCGDTFLGGDDFDERLTGFFLSHVKNTTGLDLTTDNRALAMRLKEIAERTKILLSDSPYVRVQEAAIAIVGKEPVNLDLEVDRKEYEEMIMDLVGKTLDKVHDALHEAHLSPADIGEVLLVGGSTRTPVVQQSLAEMFDRPMYYSVDPDLCVSLGAAVQGGLMSGESLGHILLDVTAHSLGVKTADVFDEETGEADYFSVIIRRNTKIPVRKAEMYYTMHTNQEGVEVEVYQGESSSCSENALIGGFFFPLKPAPMGSPVVTEFAYDKEGIVHVTVDQKGYNNRKEVTLDVRSRQVTERVAAGESEVLNYIIEKYRKLAGSGLLPENLKKELMETGGTYEQALKRGDDEDLIDELEEKLLEKIEEAEETLEESE